MTEEIHDDAEAEELKKPTKARFRVRLHLDGANEATVIVERNTTHQLVTVRPLGKRTSYVLPLADVAEMVAYKVAKAEAERKRQERKAKRR